MKNSRKILIILLLNVAIGFSQNGIKNFIDQPFIEVTGTVETEVIPNEIFLKIILNENDTKGKLSIETQENQMILTLKTLSIDTNKNLSVLNFNGTYRKKFFGDNAVTKIKHYQLIVDSGKTLTEVYEALGACDISNISITKTSHTELENFRRNTKLKALKVAKNKANDYAQAINQNIGKAIHIQENSSSIMPNVVLANNAVGANYSSLYRTETKHTEYLSLKPIILKESITAKFILN